MADAIAGLLQFAPGLVNLAQSIASATDATKRNAQLMEFQKALIGLNSLIATVQQENATLRREKDDLEAQLKRAVDWDTQSQRYQLVTPYRGLAVYALRKSMSHGEAAHYLCANCFQSRKRTFLHHSKNKDGWVTLNCPVCRSEARTEWRGVGPDKYAEDVTETK